MTQQSLPDIEARLCRFIELARASRGRMWGLGDFYNELVAQVGYRSVNARILAAKLNLHTIRVYGSACRHFPQRLRYLDRLDPSHYQAAACLPVDMAMALLDRADHEEWSTARIRWEARRIKGDLRNGPDITNCIAGLVAQHERFRTILADPPWCLWPTRGKRGGSDSHYDSMDIDDICRLKVAEIADPRAFVFLWAPATAVPWVSRVMEAWGFSYAGQMMWHKTGEFGTGEYCRYNHENLFFGRTPQAPGHFRDRSIPSTFEAPRGRRHSEKPDIAYDLIERASYPRYCELFARKRYSDQWTALGNQLLAPANAGH
jgi:N6-adenosine-specific RNA methylase IME4